MLLGVGYLYRFVMSDFFFLNSREQQIKKQSVGQKFKKLFFCFCLKQGRPLLQTNKLTWFRLSSRFQKPNQRRHNLSQIVLNIMTFFTTALHFLIFKVNFDQRTIRFDPCFFVLRISSKKFFSCFKHLWNRNQEQNNISTLWFETYFSFNALNKFSVSIIFKKFELEIKYGLDRIVLPRKFCSNFV